MAKINRAGGGGSGDSGTESDYLLLSTLFTRDEMTKKLRGTVEKGGMSHALASKIFVAGDRAKSFIKEKEDEKNLLGKILESMFGSDEKPLYSFAEQKAISANDNEILVRIKDPSDPYWEDYNVGDPNALRSLTEEEFNDELYVRAGS